MKKSCFKFSISIFILCMLETFGWIYLPVNASVVPSSREYLSRSNTIRASASLAHFGENAKDNEYMDLDSIRDSEMNRMLEVPELLEKDLILPITLQNALQANHPPKGRKEFSVLMDSIGDQTNEANASEQFALLLTLRNYFSLSSPKIHSNQSIKQSQSVTTKPTKQTFNAYLTEQTFLMVTSFISLPGVFSGAKDVFFVLLTSVTAIMQILTVCAVGTLLAFRGILDSKTSQTIGNMVFNFLLPCLLFTDMALSFNMKQFFSFISVAFYAVMYPIIGFLLGKIVKFFCSPPQEIERAITMSICFGNAAFIPLTLTAAVAASSTGIFATPNAQENAVQYVSIYVSAFSLVYWTVAPQYMSKGITSPSQSNRDISTDCSEENLLSALEKEEAEKGDVVSYEMTSLEKVATENSTETSTAIVSDYQPETIHENNVLSHIQFTLKTAFNKVKSAGATFCKYFLSPPTIAVLFGLTVGLILPLKHLFFSLPPESVASSPVYEVVNNYSSDINAEPLYTLIDYNADLTSVVTTSSGYAFVPFEFLTNAMAMVGSAALPCSMIVLGVNMSSGPKREKINKRTIFGVTTARLFLLPLIGIVITMTLKKFEILPDDPILLFILMLEGATPSAMSLVLICQKNGKGEKDMATLQFWVYISSALSLTLFVSIFMYILQ